jgi:hypothetical protein
MTILYAVACESRVAVAMLLAQEAYRCIRGCCSLQQLEWRLSLVLRLRPRLLRLAETQAVYNSADIQFTFLGVRLNLAGAHDVLWPIRPLDSILDPGGNENFLAAVQLSQGYGSKMKLHVAVIRNKSEDVPSRPAQ